MKINLYTKVMLTVIAVALVTILARDVVSPAYAGDGNVISTILNCLDGSRINNGRFSTYCNG
jgi:hypothetical protein